MSTRDALSGRVQLQHLAIGSLIQWGDHLSVDHPGIDAQHRAIFDLGAGIYDHWREGRGIDELRPTVDRLAGLIEAHFAYEERLLAEVGYADLARHRAEHHSLLDDLAAIRERFARLTGNDVSPAGSLLAPGWPVMRFFLEFSVGHVTSSDLAYRPTLAEIRDYVQGTA
ncbi:bacteriohemerythrin [Accumulibacter sp.]|uniref:bacteriohemerythrin n=1 Tax=Accumulibacter sp. TaxID=2053492 RepID=UPI0025FA34F9|nr:hemerythrin family protein [Accumulibacter sp.]MCM8595254.1 hemerythrin family protein [Accumulibacter sp.]MCM8626839.1 hemerythrin family protein [Accumulibacter sp.]MDS4049400.1 hemerythrin family protein [Accumulibacter sp.]